MADQKRVVIAGSGTSGLTTAMILKKTFQDYDVTVVFSDDIGIIGVGEGSTEHWRWFQDYIGIHPDEMVINAGITHKYGIRFENWSTHTKSYFHSIGGPIVQSFYSMAGYNYCLENDLLLTNSLSWRGLEDDCVLDIKGENDEDITHLGTNQYHFDTFKLNKFLKFRASEMGVKFFEGNITEVRRDNKKNITSLLVNETVIGGDFFVDCTGFSRVLSSDMKNIEFNSFSNYLPCDSALVFQTDPDQSGEIHPFTRAIAMDAGWMWEIPTQGRRGNGYVFSSKYIDEQQALAEAEKFHGIKIEDYRVIKFRPGYYSCPWQNNCVAIGLSYSFIEPLEATTISIGIQQAKLLCSYIANYNKDTKYLQNAYNKVMSDIMENAVSMIALHYISDREDTPMWKDQKNAKKPDLLKSLLEIWSERNPEPVDVPSNGYELFGPAHLWHVAQGQGILNRENATVSLNASGLRGEALRSIINSNSSYLSSKVISHAKAIERTKLNRG